MLLLTIQIAAVYANSEMHLFTFHSSRNEPWLFYVVQISAMLVRWPECVHAAVYPAVTISSAILMGLGVYGIPTWIHMS